MPSLLPLARLLQLASPALPIGAYSYSQGLEQVVEDGVMHDAASTRQWIGDVLEFVVACGEAAAAWRLQAATREGDWQAFARWNTRVCDTVQTLPIPLGIVQHWASTLSESTDGSSPYPISHPIDQRSYP